MACNEFTFRTADIQEIFYFNSYNVSETWTDFPEKMVNGILYDEPTGYWNVAATTVNNQIQWCDGNSSPTDRSTTITKVEIRAFTATHISSPTCVIMAYLRPAFTIGDGDTHSWLPPGSDPPFALPPAWSEWFNITNDTNAPSTWTWEDVNNLGVDHWTVKTNCIFPPPSAIYTARIEIRVTWYDSIILSNPLPSSPDNKLNKQLKQFNLWEDYKLHDEGIAGQPLSFEGIEVGVATYGDDIYGVCFPLCFPICFDQIVVVAPIIKTAAQIAQEKFEKIHSWIENNRNVVLSEFGDCFNAEFVIKSFTVQSMKHPSNYAWKLSLEKVSN